MIRPDDGGLLSEQRSTADVQGDEGPLFPGIVQWKMLLEVPVPVRC